MEASWFDVGGDSATTVCGLKVERRGRSYGIRQVMILLREPPQHGVPKFWKSRVSPYTVLGLGTGI